MKLFHVSGSPASQDSPFSTPQDFRLCPFPQRMIVQGKPVVLEMPIQVQYLDLGDPQDLVALLNEELALYKIPPISVYREHPNLKPVDLSPLVDHEEEGYIILVQEAGLTIAASTEAGMYYGVQTFIQLLRAFGIFHHLEEGNPIVLPSLVIEDWPAMTIRGVSDDVSRGQAPTVANVKRFIRELAHFGLNYWFFSYEDMFRFEKHPTIGEGRGAFTADEIREIVKFGKKHHVNVVPIFQGLGHMDNILTQPEFLPYAEFPGSDCFDLSNPAIYPLLDDLYGELARAFTGPALHLGLDESWDVGAVRSKAHVEKVGIGAAYLAHYQKLHDIVTRAGKSQVFMWHDIAVKYREVLQGLPRDIILDYWRYNAAEEHPVIDEILANGLRVVVSPSCCDWARPFPSVTTSEANIENLIKYGHARDVLGQVNTSWGDFCNENLRENRFYGYIMSTVVSWNPSAFDLECFRKNFSWHFFRVDDPRVMEIFDAFRSLEEPRLKVLSRRLHIVYQQFYAHLWAHPFPNVKQKLRIKDYASVTADMDRVVQACEALENLVPINAINLQNYAYAARLVKFLCEKRTIAKAAQEYMKQLPPPARRAELNQKLDQLAGGIVRLKDQYRELWMASCKPAHLDDLLAQFDHMASFFRHKAQEFLAGQSWQNPFINSEWVYFKPTRTRGETTSFFHEINLPDRPTKAWLQVIAGNYARLYVNGEEVGVVLTRRTLSIKIYRNNIQRFDLTDHLRSGTNIIVLENVDYTGGWGLVNLFGEITLPDGTTITIQTDKSWRATHEAGTDLPSTLLRKEDVAPVQSMGPVPFVNGGLVFPAEGTLEPSHHTSDFGIGSIATRYIPPRLAFLARWLTRLAFRRGILQ